MKRRFFGIRWKIISLLMASILVSIFCTFMLVATVHVIGLIDRGNRSGFPFIYNFLLTLRQQIGILPMGILAGFALFAFLFFILSRKYIRYIEKISGTVQEISLGRFDIRIPRKPYAELGDLADNINRMTARLKTAVEEERNAVKSKNELITSVSHDLRTPLTSVLGYLELAEKGQYRDEVELRRYIDVAYEKSTRMRKLIDDLFEYTKVNFGGVKIRPGTIDMNELLKQLSEEFVPAFIEAGMECRLSVPPVGCFVSGDGDLLERVFENLVTNALRYGADGKVVEISLTGDEEWVTARVVNFGEAILGIDLPHVFERFYRNEGSRSERTGGSGLGLAIAKGIVDLHGGTISVTSDREEGTSFTVRLKALNPEPPVSR